MVGSVFLIQPFRWVLVLILTNDWWFWVPSNVLFSTKVPIQTFVPFLNRVFFSLNYKSSFICSHYKSFFWLNAENSSHLWLVFSLKSFEKEKLINFYKVWFYIFNSWCFLCPLKNICWTQCHYDFLLCSYRSLTVKHLRWGLWSILG